MNRSLPFEPALDQRVSRDIVRSAIAIEHYPNVARKRWNEFQAITALGVLIFVVSLPLWLF